MQAILSSHGEHVGIHGKHEQVEAVKGRSLRVCVKSNKYRYIKNLRGTYQKRELANKYAPIGNTVSGKL